MKVLETLGKYSAKQQKGIFQYRRTVNGVQIDPVVGQADSLQGTVMVTISHDHWNAILTAIAQASNETFRIQGSTTNNPPLQDLDSIIQAAVPQLRGNTSLTSYVTAILEHEGTSELYGGLLGPGIATAIVLRRDL